METLIATTIEQPTLNGFPGKFMPLGVAQYLQDEGFRTIARLGDRRVWVETSGVQVATGSVSHPDYNLTNWSLMIQIGETGTIIIKNVMTGNYTQISSTVYQGANIMSVPFLKTLLAHAVQVGPVIVIDEDGLASRIEETLYQLLDAVVEVVCTWLPFQEQVKVWVKHEQLTTSYQRFFPQGAPIVSLVSEDIKNDLSQWMPE
ncbi:hypothetical protein DYU11_22750 [Fibrisoma montanum]|uniref:Uncharacterized protein n=1 Tax=Fibrisoma montanum TaxID=2305895 RepID=A0A418M1Y6_9BACT|nr:hypothetical protein [Fibrisoma montanum]RIV19752.1 hypothetical protein DYU11_22750 [Fibrisoma montanum]